MNVFLYGLHVFLYLARWILGFSILFSGEVANNDDVN